MKNKGYDYDKTFNDKLPKNDEYILIEQEAKNFTINYGFRTNNEFPISLNVSFVYLNSTYFFEFFQKSHAFTENTPTFMWDGQFIEKRINGRVIYFEFLKDLTK